MKQLTIITAMLACLLLVASAYAATNSQDTATGVASNGYLPNPQVPGTSAATPPDNTQPVVGIITDTLTEGQVQTYNLNGIHYEVALVFVSDPSVAQNIGADQQNIAADPNTGHLFAKFSVNGELTSGLSVGQTQSLQNGAIIVVNDIISAGRDGKVSFIIKQGITPSTPPDSTPPGTINGQPPNQYCQYNGLYIPVGKSYYDGCNTCSCTEKGVVACTMRYCLNSTDPSQPTTPPSTTPPDPSNNHYCQYNGLIIPVGKPFNDGCNICSCTSDGKVACTQRACQVPPGTSPPDNTNAPDGLFSLGKTEVYTFFGQQYKVMMVYGADPSGNTAAPTVRFTVNNELTPELGIRSQDAQSVLVANGKLKLTVLKMWSDSSVPITAGTENTLTATQAQIAADQTTGIINNGLNTQTANSVDHALTAAQDAANAGYVGSSNTLTATQAAQDAAAQTGYVNGKAPDLNNPTVTNTNVPSSIDGKAPNPDGNYQTPPQGVVIHPTPVPSQRNFVLISLVPADGTTAGSDNSATHTNNGDATQTGTIAGQNGGTATGQNGGSTTGGVNACASGCFIDSRCLPYGTRVANGESRFCDINGTLDTQKADGSVCQNNYECVSNQCLNAKCMSLEKQVQAQQNTLDNIVSWLKSVFGFGKSTP